MSPAQALAARPIPVGRATAAAGCAGGAGHGERPATILLVEADEQLAMDIGAQLIADGHRPQLARSAEHARALAAISSPALAIIGELDPPRGSLDLLEQVRAAPTQQPAAGRRPSPWPADLPVIVLSSQVEDLDMLRAFEAGADDFLSRPPRCLELRVRVRALLRRASGLPHSASLRVGRLTLELDAREARIDGCRVDLRRMEYELLARLATDPARVFSKQELLGGVWGYRAACTTRTLDSHASRLRRKLASAGGGSWVVSVRGVGYRLL